MGESRDLFFNGRQGRTNDEGPLCFLCYSSQIMEHSLSQNSKCFFLTDIYTMLKTHLFKSL